MIYYLTGTGNSRWAAQLLADHPVSYTHLTLPTIWHV